MLQPLYYFSYEIVKCNTLFITGSRQIKTAAGRKEDLEQATVYLYNNGIRFTKEFYPSSLKEKALKPCQNAIFFQNCNEGEKYRADQDITLL